MSSKVFISTLRQSMEIVNNEIYLRKKKIDYIWIQGFLHEMSFTSDQPDENADVIEALVDDGTGIIIVLFPRQDIINMGLKVGDYLMIQGRILVGEDGDTGEFIIIIESRIVNKLIDPNLETLWILEVIESEKRT